MLCPYKGGSKHMNRVGKRIKELCEKNSMSIEQLSDTSGVPISTIRYKLTISMKVSISL